MAAEPGMDLITPDGSGEGRDGKRAFATASAPSARHSAAMPPA